MRSLLCPDAVFKHLCDITPVLVSKMGVRALIVDLDNTLVAPHTARPTAEALAWLDGMRRAGILTAIVSNNKLERVAEFARGLDIPFIHRAAKPMPQGFRRALRELCLPPAQVAVLGDQLFTDVLGARLCGLKVLLVAPIVQEGDAFFRLKRSIERSILKKRDFNI